MSVFHLKIRKYTFTGNSLHVKYVCVCTDTRLHMHQHADRIQRISDLEKYYSDLLNNILKT